MKSLSISILITLMFAVYGCGTRKVDLQTKDSIHVENSYSQGTKIVLGNTFTYRPFDTLKPMIIDNVVYKNVVITNDKSKTITKWKDRFITKTITKEKTKQTEKTDYTIMIIGLGLIIGAFLYLKRVFNFNRFRE